MLDTLKEDVLLANCALVEQGLVLGTWGNASAVDREAGVLVIKPSGVAYEAMAPSDMVVVSLETGEVEEGSLKPSSDTPTHRELYRHFTGIGAVVHTHSHYATCWAQARQAIPCLGTTHADHFYGEIPVTETMTVAEVEGGYEANTGMVIVRCFSDLDPMEVPGVLVAQHGPFTWGATLELAVENAVVLEAIARMARDTLALRPDITPLPQHVLDKHFRRKYGKNAYYGQD